MLVEEVATNTLGFCPDNSPDKVVGIATNRLLVGSQDVAHDLDLFKTSRGHSCAQRGLWNPKRF